MQTWRSSLPCLAPCRLGRTDSFSTWQSVFPDLTDKSRTTEAALSGSGSGNVDINRGVAGGVNDTNIRAVTVEVSADKALQAPQTIIVTFKHVAEKFELKAPTVTDDR